MEGGHQRRALPACGDVAAAEVADGEDAAQFRQQRQVGKLDAVTVFRRVAHGLAVAADGGNLCRRQSGIVQQFADCLRVEAGKRLRQHTAAVQFVCADVLQVEQLLPEAV